MDIYSYFHLRLREFRTSGLTDREVAERAGVSHAQINRMLNLGPTYFETVGLKTLVKLFPDVFEAFLRQQGQTAIANANGAVAINGNNNVVGSIEAEKQRFAGEVLDDKTMCAECKVRVLQMLKR